MKMFPFISGLIRFIIAPHSPDHGYEVFLKPEIRDASGYYIQYGHELPQEVKLNKRQVLQQLKGNGSELQEYISQQELNLRKEEDVIKLIRYYNLIDHKPGQRDRTPDHAGIGNRREYGGKLQRTKE